MSNIRDSRTRWFALLELTRGNNWQDDPAIVAEVNEIAKPFLKGSPGRVMDLKTGEALEFEGAAKVNPRRNAVAIVVTNPDGKEIVFPSKTQACEAFGIRYKVLDRWIAKCGGYPDNNPNLKGYRFRTWLGEVE